MRDRINSPLAVGLLASFVSLATPLEVIAEEESVEATAQTLPGMVSRTGKERLAGKATDEQRVNDCKVPEEARGSKKRPVECAVVKTPQRVSE